MLSYILIILTILYSVIFIVGTSGNVWMLTSVCTVLRKNWVWKRSHSVPEHLYLYIGALAFQGLLVLSVIPFIVAELHIMEWVFGEILCKYAWSVETLSKLLTIAILTALSVDRYSYVCHFNKWHVLKRKRTVFAVLILCFFSIFVIIIPLFLYVRVQSLSFAEGNLNITQTKCSLDHNQIPDKIFTLYVLYLFVMGYCMPGAITLFCYWRIVLFIQRQAAWRKRNCDSRLLKRNSLAEQMIYEPTNYNKKRRYRDKTVLESIYKTVIFYFVCWTPYWISQLLPIFVSIRYPNWIIALLMCIHTFPYVNCAGNWLFYLYMNRQLRQLTQEASGTQTNFRLRSKEMKTNLSTDQSSVIETSNCSGLLT